MRQRDKEVILGVVVFVAIVSAVIGVAWLSSRLNLRVGDYRIHILFDDLKGLHAGDHVNVGGMQVGKVMKTELHGGRPAAYTAIWGLPAGIPKDSRLTLKSESLLGGYVVDILPGGSSETIESGSYMEGKSSVGLESLAPEAKRLSDRLMDPESGILGEASLRRIESVLVSLDSATSTVHHLLAQNGEPINSLVDSLLGAVSQAKGMLGENRPDVKRTFEGLSKVLSRLDSVSSEMKGASGSLRHASANLREITDRINRGEGTVGKLLKDERLYDDIRGTLAEADSLLVDIKRDPKKYLHFSVF